MMAAKIDEAELSGALQAGARFRSAIRTVHYNESLDEMVFETQWGKLTLARKEVPIFKDISQNYLSGVYVSMTGVHIDELDLDVNSAGLLGTIFRELANSLSSSF